MTKNSKKKEFCGKQNSKKINKLIYKYIINYVCRFVNSLLIKYCKNILKIAVFSEFSFTNLSGLAGGEV